MHVQVFVEDDQIIKTHLQSSQDIGFSWEICGGRVSEKTKNTVSQWLTDYCASIPSRVELPIHIGALAPFTSKVLNILYRVPFASVLTYQQLAAEAGNPRASRAVGNACARNPLPLFIPCHRVLAFGNSLEAFSQGIEIKKESS